MDNLDDPVLQATTVPSNEGEAVAKIQRLQGLKLPQLEAAMKVEQDRGTYDDDLAAVYQETAGGKAQAALDSISKDVDGKELPLTEMHTRAMDAMQNGDISKDFFENSVSSLIEEAAKRHEKEGTSWSEVGKGLVGAPVGFAKSVYGAAKAAGEEGAKAVAGAMYGMPEVSQPAANKIATGLETGFQQGISSLQGMAHALTPKFIAAPVEKFLHEQTGGLVKDTSAEQEALKKGDSKAWWEHFKANREQQYLTSRGEGPLAKAVGLSTSELAKDGYKITADEHQQSNQLGMFSDPTMAAGAVFNPLEIGAHLGKSVGMAVRTSGVAPKIVGVIDRVASKAGAAYESGLSKIAGSVESGSLAPMLETKAQAATRLAGEASDIAEKVKNARLVQAAGKIQALGTAIKNSAGTPVSGLTAAGAAVMAGADPKEALIAGIAGTLLGRPAARVTNYIGGTALEMGGKLAGRVALPMSDLASAVSEFNSTYKVGRTAAAGAIGGIPTGAMFALGAEDDQSKGAMLGLPMWFGAMGGAGRRIGQGVNDAAVRRAFGGNVSNAPQGPIAPREPIGSVPQADAIHAAAERALTQDSLRQANAAHELTSALGAEFYVGKDAADLQRLHDSLSKVPLDVSGSQGVTISANDSVTGKPIALAQAGGQARGHETWHAVMAAMEALPAGEKVVNRITGTAASALGAVWDPTTGKLSASSPELEKIREDYQRRVPFQISSEYALQEYIAEHANAMFSGLPPAKLGGSATLSKVVGDAILKVSDAYIGRKPGLTQEGVTTSKVLKYSPSTEVRDTIQNVIDAVMYENSPDIPSASLESQHPSIDSTPIPPVETAPNPLRPSGPIAKGTTVPVRPENQPTFNGGEGILNPIPSELATDQSLKNSTPPQQTRPEAASPAEAPTSEVTPQGAIRGQEVQAARTNTEAALSPEDKALVQKVQTDPAKQPVLERVISFVKSLGGQRVGLPIVEASINQDGVVRSKRLAPYDIDRSSPDKPVVLSVDLDRANYNAKLLFDWAAQKGTADRFGYAGVNDPKFTQDLQTYLRNQAEGRRGSGETLTAEGVPPATGEAFGKLSRDQELFFNTLMGQTPPKELTARSLGAIARINATAKASGITPRTTETGSVEPNSLRDSLRTEGAPIDRIGEDPDPTRRQTNPKDRNSVITRTRLQDFVDFKPTSQSVSQPNIRAIEASFMPSEAPKPASEKVKFDEFKKFFSDVTKGSFGKSDKPFIPEMADKLNSPELRRAVEVRQSHAGNFDDHIQKSIPTFYEAQIGTMTALADSLPKGATVLDIAASEGSYGKSVTALSNGNVKTVSLDPNLDMAKFFNEKSKVQGAEYSTDAFGATFEDDGRVVPQHAPAKKYEAIHESMGFQFMSPDREGQIAEVKRLLTPDGLFLTEQKLKNPDWAANEKFKDTNHKNKYFTPEELAAKDTRVGFGKDKGASQNDAETKAVGMVANQVEHLELEQVLASKFKHVVQYWDSGNFKGYAASDSKAAVDAFLSKLPDLNSKFSNVETPRQVFHPESIEAQSLKASEAVENAKPKESDVQFMPADKPTSDEFKNWFGDWQDPKAHTSRAKGPVSYAIDSKGAPLKLVHATRNSFDRFEVGRETINSGTFGDEVTQRHAIFLAESPELSNQYVSDSTGRVLKGGRSIPVFASIKSPIDLTRSTDMYALGEELGINGRWLQNVQNHWELFDGADGKAFVEASKKAGYDGVIFSETGPDRVNDHTVYAVFDPEQVKSALAPTFNPKDPARFMPADLSKSKVKDKDVQFKRKEPLEGAVGGLLEGVHFSSRSLAEIDPKKSFGKGAATSTDMQGEPKVFFYKKGTAYEAPISARSNVYEAKIDGNSIYDYNEDALGVRSIVNREKRDLALKNAGFKGFYVETPGFDAIAIFDKVGVKESSHENVMSREQLQDAGKLQITPEEAASRQAAEAASLADTKNSELRLAKAKEQVLNSKGYELAKAKIAKEVGDDYSYEYNDRLDTWADEQAAKKAASKAQFMPAQRGLVPEATERATVEDLKKSGIKNVEYKAMSVEHPTDVKLYNQLEEEVYSETPSARIAKQLAGLDKSAIKAKQDQILERMYKAKGGAYVTQDFPNLNLAKDKTSLPKNTLENSPQNLFSRLDGALEKVKADPERLATPSGYAEYMKDAGISGDAMTAPPLVKMLLKSPDEYVRLLDGGYHGDKTVAGTKEAANAGLDATVKMREAIGGRPPELITALHHMWGILSRMLPPVEQEAMWLRLVNSPEVRDSIKQSIEGNYELTQDQWKAVVSRARDLTPSKRGNNGTTNANSFHAMLKNWNGRWNEVSDVYAHDNSKDMGRAFWNIGAGSVGIKNKVQRFIGLTFGVPGLIMDRWKYVEFYHENFGLKPADYFEYSKTGTPEDPLGIYSAYSKPESAAPNLSLAFYEGMETVLQKAIENSPALQQRLGKHANVGGLHWHGWNAIKNEAVGHSSLSLTYDLAKHSKTPTIDDLATVLKNNEYYAEGAVGNTTQRFTLPK